jgi:hypothetical protein
MKFVLPLYGRIEDSGQASTQAQGAAFAAFGLIG